MCGRVLHLELNSLGGSLLKEASEHELIPSIK